MEGRNPSSTGKESGTLGLFTRVSLGGVKGTVTTPVVEEGLLDSSLLLSSKMQSFFNEGLQSLRLEIRGASLTLETL